MAATLLRAELDVLDGPPGTHVIGTPGLLGQ